MNTRITLLCCTLFAFSTLVQAGARAENQTDVVTGNKLDAKHGRKVYQSSCASCHDKGKGDAPRLDQPETWKSRSFESFSVMENHAKNGFLTMPPKGRRPLLSNQDIADAVFYMTGRLEGGK